MARDLQKELADAITLSEGAFPDAAAARANKQLISKLQGQIKDQATAAEITAATQAARDTAPIRTLQNVADQSAPTIVTQLPSEERTENRPQGAAKPETVTQRIQGLDETIKKRERFLRSL